MKGLKDGEVMGGRKLGFKKLEKEKGSGEFEGEERKWWGKVDWKQGND